MKDLCIGFIVISNHEYLEVIDGWVQSRQKRYGVVLESWAFHQLRVGQSDTDLRVFEGHYHRSEDDSEQITNTNPCFLLYWFEGARRSSSSLRGWFRAKNKYQSTLPVEIYLKSWFKSFANNFVSPLNHYDILVVVTWVSSLVRSPTGSCRKSDMNTIFVVRLIFQKRRGSPWDRIQPLRQSMFLVPLHSPGLGSELDRKSSEAQTTSNFKGPPSIILSTRLVSPDRRRVSYRPIGTSSFLLMYYILSVFRPWRGALLSWTDQ